MVRLPAYGKAGGYIFSDHPVQLLKLCITLIQLHTGHPAANIHSQELRNYPVCHCHGQSDGTHLAGMDVRHHTDSAALGYLTVTYHLNLSLRIRLHILREDPGLRIDSLHYFHIVLSPQI